MTCSHANQCEHYNTLENQLPLGALGLNAFNHPQTFQVSYVFPPLALVLLVLSKFLAEHVIDQFRLLILVAPWVKTPWLLTVLKILEDISHHCPILKNLIMNVLVDWVLSGLLLLDLNLWLLRDVYQADKDSHPQFVRHLGGT